MPKYFAEKIFGHWLYFTTHCILEAMHVHASQDSKLREKGAAKFFVYADGTSKMMVQGTLRNHEVPLVQDFIKQHYRMMAVSLYLSLEEILFVLQRLRGL